MLELELNELQMIGVVTEADGMQILSWESPNSLEILQGEIGVQGVVGTESVPLTVQAC